MMLIYESTYADLYASVVEAFPHTTRRQYATDPIKVSGIQIVPFVGVRTLFIKADAINEDRHYRSMILLKDIQYEQNLMTGGIEVVASDGRHVYLHRPSLDDNNVLVRCSCNDFHWRLNYFNHLDKSLYGRKRSPYEAKINPGSANPLRSEGVCKHIMKMAQVLKGSGFLI